MYKQKKHLTAHVNAEHKKKKHACSKCQKEFKYASDANRHEKTCNCEIEHVCTKCQKRCSSAQGLRSHLQWHATDHNDGNRNKPKTKPLPSSTPRRFSQSATTVTTCKQYRCRRCADTFDNRHDLYVHGMRAHYQVGGALQRRPWGQNNLAPWQHEDGTSDGALRDVYEANAPIILETGRQGPIQSIFNFPLTNQVSINQLMDFAENIFQQQHHAFRLNLVFGVILRNRETGQYRYFVPYTNNGVLERALYVSRRADLERLRIQLQQKDITTELLRNRPDTKWIPVLVTNVRFPIWSTYYPIGQGQLPDFLLKKDSLYHLVRNRHTGKLYDDNLCAFRCLALHRGHDIKSIERPAHAFYGQWMAEKAVDDFDGLSYDQFPEFEKCFGVNLEVFSLEESGFARSLYKSRGQQETTMYVNLFDNHMSYIRNFSSFAQKYQCQTCDRHFNHVGHLHRHQRTCTNKTKYVYPGGFHRLRESIFEELDKYGIDVPSEERTFPWFICYDFEAILQKVDDKPTGNLAWTHQHVPISVSLCCNVESHQDPVCLVDPDPNQLVKRMVSTMTDIANTVYELAEAKWGWVLEAIKDKINKDEKYDQEEHDIYDTEDVDDEEVGGQETKKPSHPLQEIYGCMERYMSQVPIIGFNSAKYDLNLIKRCLAKHLEMHEASQAFVIKKDNAYACIATDKLKFLDITQYLAAGSSYAGFLKAYQVAGSKGHFPYEWFDSIEKLDFSSLPAHQCFYSCLKGTNISEAEYEYCQMVWQSQGMTTFRDFLVWYNNLDVGPFVEAVEKFQLFYFEKGIDVFKTAISVPGIARQMLFRTAREQQANFALFDSNNADLYHTIKANIVGGPSIIFTRHHCAGKTCIRGQKPCRAILGFDANALYLQAIGEPMPVGPFIRRLAVNDFRPEVRDKYMAAYYWMDWIANLHGIQIEHRLNTGREVRIGPYPVDGYAKATQPGSKPTVFQFHGCYWHGHQCEITRGIRDDKWYASRASRYQRTLEISKFISRDHHLVESWECEFRQYCRSTPLINDFIDNTKSAFFRRHKGQIAEEEILTGVAEGKLFGMVEVDIEVPEEWPGYRIATPTLTPYEYFQEMSPIFCNTEVTFDDIGQHMQAHIWENHLSDKPRRLLVGGMKARQILLATPLLQWYLKHGLLVTKVYQVVEFQQQRCFRDFVKEVSDARRQGDIDPDTAIIADTNKVIGNSGYGSLIMDKSKHRQIKNVQGKNETCLKVNDPLFQKLDCLDEEEQLYEVEMAKRKIKLDLPIQLGYFILQYAKLRMLEFYFDFMDVYVDRSDFEYCEMDTDSAYMAISGSCLEDIIKPEMREIFEKGLKGFCTDMDIEADTEHHWFPRTCCTKHAKFDKRTPGLFKLEYKGDEMIGLCSKTYIVRSTKCVRPSPSRRAAYHLLRRSMKLRRKRCHFEYRKQNDYKFSSKGISKRFVKAPMTQFRRVLKTSRPQGSLNRGFRVRNNAVFTYTQERRGFSYLYCKRKVLEDGIHTEPLDITLCPLSSQEREVSDQDLIDMLASNFED